MLMGIFERHFESKSPPAASLGQGATSDAPALLRFQLGKYPCPEINVVMGSECVTESVILFMGKSELVESDMAQVVLDEAIDMLCFYKSDLCQV